MYSMPMYMYICIVLRMYVHCCESIRTVRVLIFSWNRTYCTFFVYDVQWHVFTANIISGLIIYNTVFS